MKLSWFPSGSFSRQYLKIFFLNVTDGVSNFTPVLIIYVSLLSVINCIVFVMFMMK